MRQPLGRVGGEVIHVVEVLNGEEAGDQLVVDYRAFDEVRLGWHVLNKAPAEIIENNDIVTTLDQGARHVSADEPSPACY